MAFHEEEGTHHGATEVQSRDGVNLRRFLGRNHTQVYAMVVLEREKRVGVLAPLPPYTTRSRKSEIAEPCGHFESHPECVSAISDLREPHLRVSVTPW